MLDSYYDKENYFALSKKKVEKGKKNYSRIVFSTTSTVDKPLSRNKTQGLIKSLKDLSLVGVEDKDKNKTKRYEVFFW